MTNAIMQRVDQLTELWDEFAANPDARLACWQLDHDSIRLFDLFLELQNEEADDLPDLFIRCNEPFTKGEKFGIELRASLIEKYDEIREAIELEGILATWQCPERRREQDDIDALLAACESLQQSHQDIVRHVALAILPHTLSSPKQWRQWLERLIAKPIPPAVRFLIVDNANDPQLADLKEAQPKSVSIIRPELKVGLGYLELLREVPGTGPGFIFRRFFVALGNAISCGNLSAAQRLAEQATRIATQQQWTHLQSAVAVTLGAAFLQQQDFDAAIRCFVNGQTAVAGQSDPASSKVGIQAKLAEASALIAANRPSEAATAYNQVKELAKKSGDSFAQFESTRMAAYCYELSGSRDEAWKSGLETLTLAETMNSQSAKAATLPYAGQALLRSAESSGKDAADIRQRLERLLGKNWDAALQAETSS
jgi:hypothetical protein